MNPDIEWLTSRWNLPEATVPLITRHLAAIRDGSTALELPAGSKPQWGDSAATARAGGEPPDSPRPLVVVEHGSSRFLQSWLHYKAEHEIARRLRGRLDGDSGTEADPGSLAALFPNAGPGDLQRKAVEVSLRKRLALITGGPGTGKTHTLVRILAMLVEQGVSASKIRLAAPTGKAADRMKKAVTESLATLPGRFARYIEDLKTVAGCSTTLHSLLGANPSTGCCRHNEQNPLPFEVLILDECSMVDVLLWQALLKAAPDTAPLILVGDPNQLESVGQGNVLAELVRVARTSNAAIRESWVHLTEARRFKDRRAILSLADALEKLEPDRAVEILENSKDPSAPNGVAWIPSAAVSCAEFPASVMAGLTAVADAETPADALEALSRICILTAQREHFVGSKATSAAIDTWFAAAATGGRRPNQPIIINQNDPETGLRNGSVGVITTDSAGVRRAWFPGVDGKLKDFAVARLPDHGPAWAITIHRSQGSEYDEVLVVLPRGESPMATRELLYTAITRAKRTVYIAGELESVRKAAGNPSSRVTLLGAHLAG